MIDLSEHFMKLPNMGGHLWVASIVEAATGLVQAVGCMLILG